MPLPRGIRNEGNIDFRHATRYQRYHDNTPAVALQRDLMQSAEDSLLPSPLLDTCGHEKERWKKGTHVPPATATMMTKKQILQRAETPQSKRIVALGTHSSCASISLSQARTMEQKPVFLSRLGDSV